MTTAFAPKVTVNIVGKTGTIDVDITDNSAVGTVVAAAFEAVGLDTAAIPGLSTIKNGEDADLTDKVEAGDEVTAAPQVANG